METVIQSLIEQLNLLAAQIIPLAALQMILFYVVYPLIWAGTILLLVRTVIRFVAHLVKTAGFRQRVCQRIYDAAGYVTVFDVDSSIDRSIVIKKLNELLSSKG